MDFLGNQTRMNFPPENEWGTADPENTGSKKKSNFFGFPWGFCMDFLGNQTRMNFSGKRIGGCCGSRSRKHGEKKKSKFFGFPWGFCMDFIGNQTRMNFPENKFGDPENTGSKKKKKIGNLENKG